MPRVSHNSQRCSEHWHRRPFPPHTDQPHVGDEVNVSGVGHVVEQVVDGALQDGTAEDMVSAGM